MEEKMHIVSHRLITVVKKTNLTNGNRDDRVQAVHTGEG